MLKKIFPAITLILVVFLLLIALVPSSANAEIVYGSDIVRADAATIRNDDNERLGVQADVANFNPVYLGASWSTAPTYDFVRTIMVYDLSYMNPYATITNITLNFYVYDYITSDGMYITETTVSSDPTADDYELSHYTNVIGTLLPTSKNAWYNVTITDYSSFIPGEKVYIGLIMKRDYANLGGQAYNFVNARGTGYADSAYRPSMYIAYYLKPWNPIITSTPSEYANVSQEYSYSPTANETVKWNLLDYPDGVNWSDNKITWFPNETGFFTFQLYCNNSAEGYAYQNWTVFVFPSWIAGGDNISDEMFGFIALLAMITILNLYAMKSGTGLLSIFALMGLIISASLLWPDSPITTALLMVTVLGNIAITIKTVT